MTPRRCFVFLLIAVPVMLKAQLNIQYYIQEGIAELIKSNFVVAQQRFNAVVMTKPDKWEAYYLRGVSKFYLGDNYGARSDFNKGIEINPFFSELYLFRGITYQFVNDYSTAFDNFRKALELDPSNASIYASQGLVKLALDDYQAALQLFSEAIAMNPDYQEAYFFRAVCYSELKNSHKAFDDFKKALLLNKFDDRVYVWRAKLKVDFGDLREALEDFNKAIKINDENGLAYYQRSFVRYDMKDLKGALEDLDKVISISPNNSLALFNRAQLRSEIGLWNDALKDYELVTRINADNVLAWYNKALIEIEMGEYLQSVRSFSNAIALYPDFYYGYISRAHALQKLNDVKGANADYIKASQIKEQQKDNQYSDSAKFKELVKFDGDFEKNQDYFLMNKIMKEKSDVALLPLFYLTAGADSSENAYYLPYLELLNKKRKAPFAFVSRVNTKTLTSGDFLSSHDSGIVAGVRIALEGNYNSSLNCFDSLAKVYPLSCNVFFNRAWVKASNVELMRTFDEMPQEISVYSNSLQLNSRVQMNHREQYFDYYGVLDDYSKVISLEPSLFYAYYNRACIQVKLYNYAEAIKDYSLAIDLNRDFKEAYYNRGITHIYLSDTTNACYDLSKAGELGVDNAYLLIRKLCRK